MSGNIGIQGIHCDIFRAKNETEHFHKDIELLFIISGHIHVVVEGNEFRVGKEEFLLINSGKNHYIYVDEDSLLSRFHISYDLMTDVFDEEYIAFWCNLITAKDPGYEELRSQTRDVIRLHMQTQEKNGFRCMEKYGRIMDLLSRYYRIETKQLRKQSDYNSDAHAQEILSYISHHYNEPLNLADLADMQYVSVSTMSRIIKKATDSKFPDYINKIRLQHAIDDLLNTNKSVTEIAVNNGFSSPSSFNRVFKEAYGTTPSQYKKSFRSNVEKKREFLTMEDVTHVQEYLGDHHAGEMISEEVPVVEIHPESKKVFHPISTKAVSLGAFYQLTNSSVQNQIRQMKEELDLTYIRVWNIFSPKCMIAAIPSEKNLSFEQIDIVFDFLVSIHVHPFLDMTDHPEVLIKNSRQTFFRKEDSMQFENLEQWSYFLEKLMEHVIFRYGLNEVSSWIFEFGDYSVTSGLDYYGSGEAYYADNSYKEVFGTAWRTIKGLCPEAKVGGPDWVLDGTDLNISSYFQTWEELKIVPDFYCAHLFPYITIKDDPDSAHHERNMDPDFMNSQIRYLRHELEELQAPNRPLYITETTSILSNRNAMNDHLYRATNVLRVTNLFQNYVDMICFWVATDRLSLHYAPPAILHGGSGLMSKDGIPKPTYYALYFMSKLGDTLLASGKGYMAVQNAPGNIYILCYNHKNLVFDYKYEEENVVNPLNVNSMFEDTDPMQVRFMIYGLEAGEEYVIKRHTLNQDFGSVMDEWKRLGYEQEMRGNDIAYLKKVCVPHIRMEHRVAEEGQIYLEDHMQPHEILLLHLYK